MNKIAVCLFFFLGLVSCNSAKYSYTEHPGARISFGEGGGFAGAFEQYTLFDNGQLFVQKGYDSTANEEVAKIKKKDFKKLFKSVQEEKYKTLQYDKPGNMYRFILYKKDNYSHKIQWSAGDLSAPKEAVELYKKLKSITHENN